MLPPKTAFETATTQTTESELGKNNYHWVETDQPILIIQKNVVFLTSEKPEDRLPFKQPSKTYMVETFGHLTEQKEMTAHGWKKKMSCD